jgi:hypothetical protein
LGLGFLPASPSLRPLGDVAGRKSDYGKVPRHCQARIERFQALAALFLALPVIFDGFWRNLQYQHIHRVIHAGACNKHAPAYELETCIPSAFAENSLARN